jgi:hypothetical protein
VAGSHRQANAQRAARPWGTGGSLDSWGQRVRRLRSAELTCDRSMGETPLTAPPCISARPSTGTLPERQGASVASPLCQRTWTIAAKGTHQPEVYATGQSGAATQR